MEAARSVGVILILLFSGLAGCVGGGDPQPATPTVTPTAPTPTPTTPVTPTPNGEETPPVTPKWEIGDSFFVNQGGPAGSGVAAVGHLNDDEEFDVFLGGGAGGSLFLGGDGGTFTDVTGQAGLACPGCVVVAAQIGDVNEDKINDLLVLTNERLYVYLNDGEAGFVDAAAVRGLDGVSGQALGLVDVDIDGDLDIAVAADADMLVYRNDGQGVFSAPDVVAGAGGTAFAFLFVDDDASFDLVVATPTGLKVFMNKDAVFTEAAGKAAVPDGVLVNTLFAFDYDSDQGVDLLVATDTGTLVLRNNRRGAFSDETAALGLNTGGAKSAIAFDADNDGWLDILALESAAPRLLLSTTGQSFKDADATGLGGTFAALAGGDFDRDGRFDFLGLPASGSSTLFLNRADAGPYFTLHLRGNESNDAGIGAKVTLSTGTFIMFRQSGGGGSAAAAMPIDPFFGIGKNLVEKYTLAITWPSGILQFENIEQDRVVNRQLNARESASDAPWAEC